MVRLAYIKCLKNLFRFVLPSSKNFQKYRAGRFSESIDNDSTAALKRKIQFILRNISIRDILRGIKKKCFDECHEIILIVGNSLINDHRAAAYGPVQPFLRKYNNVKGKFHSIRVLCF